MKKIVLLIAVMAIVVSCNQKQTKTTRQEPQKMLHFQNELLSVDYPATWTYEDEWNNMCDTLPALTRGYRLTLYSSSPKNPWPVVNIQRSSMPDCFHTPENWRNANNELSKLSSDGKYLGVVEGYMQDSLRFGEFPAALGAYVFEINGDTIIQKQLVVKVENDVYFLNNSFQFHNKNDWQELLGDSILETVRFKAE